MICKLYAINKGEHISGTTQVGNIAVATGDVDLQNSGIQWWMGPDEGIGYVICGEHNIQKIQFWRSKNMSENSFFDLLRRNFHQFFSDISDANIWLNNNGYYSTTIESKFIKIGDDDILLNNNDKLIYK